MKDFFISYNRYDLQWAEWIASVLEEAKYSTFIQAWDFIPGTNFVSEMHRASIECSKTISLLSPEYLASLFTLSEWAVAFSSDPDGTKRKLIPVRVRACEPPGLLKTLVYCDLVGLGEQEAKQAIIKWRATGSRQTRVCYLSRYGSRHPQN